MPDSSSDPPSPPDKDPLDPLARLTVWLDRHHRSLSKVLYAGAAVGAVVIVASVRGVRDKTVRRVQVSSLSLVPSTVLAFLWFCSPTRGSVLSFRQPEGKDQGGGCRPAR